MKIIENPEEHWTQVVSDKLEGCRVLSVRYMTRQEADESGWYRRPLVMKLHHPNGDFLLLYPMQDDEGNDGGAMGTSLDDLPTIPVLNVY